MGDWPATADVVVVGGGIVGAATAFYAARAGLSVVLVERRTALGALTTAASAASFRAQFTDAANIALMRESIAVFERFGEVIGDPACDIRLRQGGYLFVSDRAEDIAALRARVGGPGQPSQRPLLAASRSGSSFGSSFQTGLSS